MPECALLLVNYLSAAHSRRAIASARAASREALHVVVVDNSCLDTEASALASSGADDVVIAQRNLGYGGGANLGLSRVAQKFVIVANPDVVFGSGAIHSLIGTLDSKNAGAAGPALFWDSDYQWHLPPAYIPAYRTKASHVLSLHSSQWAARRMKRMARKRIAFWNHQEPFEAEAISGAVMAMRSDELRGMGGFDERFRLYFEESDLLRRVRGAGKSIIVNPASRCRHLYNQSAAMREDSESVYLDSEHRYYEKWYGRRGVALLRAARGRNPRSEAGIHASGRIALTAPAGTSVVEVSPLPDFESAAGCFPMERSFEVPEEIWEASTSLELYAREVDRRSGRAIATWVLGRPGRGSE